MKTLFLLFVLTIFSLKLMAQNEPAYPTQIIKGQLIDNNSKFPLPGAQIVVLGDKLLGAQSDADGYYKIKNVPLGRQTLKVSLIGYAERLIPNVLVTAGKEYVLNLGMDESIIKSQEVVITAEKVGDKGQAKNEMALLSARSFNVEETRRFAGSRNDPSRMASNFAGVSGVNDGRNDIIIRGNAPTGLLWRMEGADIPNPSHFGSLGATGGPVSMLNNNVLETSDFLTGAFPAEYGNALSGVFDLSMRNGNQEKREYTGQIGFNGFELGAEGPFSKNSRSSYMANYRYTTLGVFSKIGINVGTGKAVPIYQDLNFKMNFITGKFSKVSVYGILGNSHIDILGKDVDTTNLYADNKTNTHYATSMGTVGVNYMHFFDEKTYGKLILSASGNTVKAQQDSLPIAGNPDNAILNYGDKSSNNRTSVRYIINRKFNARSTVTAGAYVDRLGFDFQDSALKYTPTHVPYFQSYKSAKGATFLYQAHLQYQYKFTDRLLGNAGVHYQQLALNNANVIEPRAAIQYAIDERQSISLGYGLHSQIQTMNAYFYRTPTAGGGYTETNRNLGFTKSNQVVLGYKTALTGKTRLKFETYFQQLYNAPVEQRSTSFSLLNSGANFNYITVDSLVNNGKGQNMGVELTLERSFSNGYYFLVTTSIYDSKYQGSDGVWRNTAFNNKFIVNFLGGYEFKLSDQNVLAFDTKVTVAGGKPYTPVDYAKSTANRQLEVYDDQAYSKQFQNYFRTDLKVTFRHNGKKAMQEFFIDVQNIFNTQNVYQQSWNPDKAKTYMVYQLGLFPNINYRINF